MAFSCSIFRQMIAHTASTRLGRSNKSMEVASGCCQVNSSLGALRSRMPLTLRRLRLGIIGLLLFSSRHAHDTAQGFSCLWTGGVSLVMTQLAKIYAFKSVPATRRRPDSSSAVSVNRSAFDPSLSWISPTRFKMSDVTSCLDPTPPGWFRQFFEWSPCCQKVCQNHFLWDWP